MRKILVIVACAIVAIAVVGALAVRNPSVDL